MFTGLVETIGRVASARRSSDGGLRLTIDLGPTVAEGVKPGDSINISGVCQTVVAVAAGRAEFDCVPETLRKTTLGDLRAGRRVNLERSLHASARIGGHFVTGHVDAAGAVVERRQSGAEHLIRIRVPRPLTAEMVARGSVAVDGVSLTIVEAGDEDFTVALIPLTLRETTLGALAVGDAVNVETDILAKYVGRILGSRAASAEGISIEMLERFGFSD